MMEHIQVDDQHNVSFPTWARTIAWVLGFGFPVAIAGGVWIAGAIFDISVRMARMEAQLVMAADDRYRASQAEDAHELLEGKIDRQAEQIIELQRLHGRR